MTPEEREATEHRLIEINRRLIVLASPEMNEEMPLELELGELYEERDQLKKELDEDVD